ncbi:SKP1-like protein 3 [Raphanus sativus]|nr:SKP1-like protein 3 [Raphanus sativus]
MSKNITLKSSYGVSFEVDEAIVLMSQRIKCMIEDDRTNNGITLSKVNSAALVNVIKYYKKHSKANADDTELKAWDINFVRNLNKDTFFALDSLSSALLVTTNGLLTLYIPLDHVIDRNTSLIMDVEDEKITW